MLLFNNPRVRPPFGKAVRQQFTNPSAGGNGLADGRSDARRHSAESPSVAVVVSRAAASDQAFDDGDDHRATAFDAAPNGHPGTLRIVR